MNLAMGIAIGIFILLWIWIAFEIHRAPTCDIDGNEIKSRRGKGIGLSRSDIDKDLFDKEDEVD